jgi:DNA-directed RNA polymerase subunit alpha
MQRNWRNLIRPKPLAVDELTETYGKFVVQPLERGYGQTLGNSLRRVLLSSIRGAAITGIRMAALGRVVREDEVKGRVQRRMVEQMQSALHEFQALPDIVEDVAEVVLNLKEVNIRLDEVQTEYISLVAEAPAGGEPLQVRAGDLDCPSTITILNPDQHLMTIQPGGRVEAELTVREGMGYVPGSRQTELGEDLPVDFLPIDAIFSPIRRVNFRVDNARVEQRTDYDKLTLEVWSNGAIDPETAVGIAAKILREQMKVFVGFEDQGEEEVVDERREEVPDEPLNENLWRSIEDLDLSVRSANCLQNAQIRLVGELVQRTEAEMLKTKNFGRKSLKEIKEVLGDLDLELGMRIDGWDPDKRPVSLQTT